jgi:hypothetical protein
MRARRAVLHRRRRRRLIAHALVRHSTSVQIMKVTMQVPFRHRTNIAGEGQAAAAVGRPQIVRARPSRLMVAP